MDVAAVRFIEKIVWEKGDGRTMSGKPTTLTDFHEKRIEGDKPCCGRSKRGKEVLQDVRLPEQGKDFLIPIDPCWPAKENGRPMSTPSFTSGTDF
uniref:Uncharacterized protein n=1 Tax=Vespula pensylvanica TaxID=30213 RepID=A0A834U9P5_VESPE|nr:hypothetical protein H0235_009051 [Vespula pensylvanica]